MEVMFCSKCREGREHFRCTNPTCPNEPQGEHYHCDVCDNVYENRITATVVVPATAAPERSD